VPQVQLATPPTQGEVQKFAWATPDIINRGVLGPTGKREPPCYHTHVDDNCYLDIAELLQHTVDCSAISLYILLGFPSEVAFSALSLDKFPQLLKPLLPMDWMLFQYKRPYSGHDAFKASGTPIPSQGMD
jgi:hypothetical protein